MTPKRKNKPDKAKKNHAYGYLPVFSPDFKADLAWWYRNEPKKGDKILDLVGFGVNLPTTYHCLKALP